MTTLDLDAIQARADAATEGPWKVTDLSNHGHRGTLWVDIDRPADGSMTVAELTEADGVEVIWKTTDAEFIAHARTDIPALIAEVKALRGKVAEVEELAQQIAENAEVNWEQDNFGAGQVQVANQILDALQSDAPTTGEPE